MAPPSAPRPARPADRSPSAARAVEGAGRDRGDTVLCLGSIVLDTIVVVERMPGEDERVVAREIVQSGGGNASTAAVAIARMGLDVDFAGVVGDDAAGRSLVSHLEAEGVGTRHVVVHDDAPTAQSVVVVTRESASRTILTRPSPPPLTVPEGYRWLHVDDLGYEAVRAGGAHGQRVSLDAGNAIADLDLSLVDLYAPTADALARRYPGRELLAAARCAREEGAGTVVATAGGRGSFAVSATETAFAPAMAVEPVSSLGAGDVFHGALLSALLLDKPLAECLRFANVAAALACAALDGRSAIPRRDRVESLVRQGPAPTTDAEAAIRALTTAAPTHEEHP